MSLNFDDLFDHDDHDDLPPGADGPGLVARMKEMAGDLPPRAKYRLTDIMCNPILCRICGQDDQWERAEDSFVCDHNSDLEYIDVKMNVAHEIRDDSKLVYTFDYGRKG